MNDEDYPLHYKVPYTKMNCEVFSNTEFYTHCSNAPFYGIDTGKIIIKIYGYSLAGDRGQYYYCEITHFWSLSGKNIIFDSKNIIFDSKNLS